MDRTLGNTTPNGRSWPVSGITSADLNVSFLRNWNPHQIADIAVLQCNGPDSTLNRHSHHRR